MMKKTSILLILIVVSVLAVALLSLRDNPARPTNGEAREAVSAGNTIRYYVSGAAEAQPVVLLASYARSGSDFNELVESLYHAGYRTIVLQARGIDGSELPNIDLNLFDYAEDLATVLDQERISVPVTLIGHAFGNRIARAFASRYPDRARSLVLLAAGDSAPPPDTRNDIFMILAGILPDSVRAGALQRAFFAPENKAPEYWLSGWYPRAGLAQGNATATTPQEQWIGGGTAPILVVQPSHDAAAAQGAAKLQSLYPERVSVVMLENARHAILPERPEQVSSIVLEHLAGR